MNGRRGIPSTGMRPPGKVMGATRRATNRTEAGLLITIDSQATLLHGRSPIGFKFEVAKRSITQASTSKTFGSSSDLCAFLSQWMCR